MLKVDIKKMEYTISGTEGYNMAEFAYLTFELINRYGKECVQKAFERGCDENLQEDNRNGQI